MFMRDTYKHSLHCKYQWSKLYGAVALISVSPRCQIGERGRQTHQISLLLLPNVPIIPVPGTEWWY